jgi:hypothetical protein
MSDKPQRLTGKRQTWFERHPVVTLVSVSVVLFLLIDFSAAFVLKQLGLFKPAYQSSSQREGVYRRSHPAFHHGLAANIDYDNAEWGGASYTVRTNSLGFKDGEVREIPLKKNGPRLLISGDSFTEGVGVEFKDTFAGHIAAHFQPQGVDVLNAAVSSYSPIIHLLKSRYFLEVLGLQIDHMVVFIDLSDMEDEALGYKLDPDMKLAVVNEENIGAAQVASEAPSLKAFLNRNTVFVAQLRVLAAYLRGALRRGEKAFDQRRAMWTMDDALYQEFGKRGQQLAAEHMLQLKALLDEHGAGLTVVVYPWPDQIVHHDLESRHVTFWRDWCKRHAVEFINLFPGFLDGEDANAVVEKYFIHGDVHWNEEGHRLVAGRFLHAFNAHKALQ